MKRRILMMLSAFLMIGVLSGCYPSRVAHQQYRYYDEALNILWQGRERNEEYESQCDSYDILTYDRNGRVTEMDDYWHVNHPEPQMHQHLRHVNIYEGNQLKARKSYSYLYDGTLEQQSLSEFDQLGRTIRYTEYSTEGRETVMSYEVFESSEDGESRRSEFYSGDGTLLNSQQWYQQENGYRVWVFTTYNQDGSIHYQRTEINDPNGDGTPVSTEEIGNPNWEGDDSMRIEIERFMAHDFTMQYFRFGQGEKTMVILPGLSIGSVMPSAQAIADEYAIFQDDYTVYVFDRRSMLPESYSVEQMARDTAIVMKQLDLHDVYLFGASQGGMMAEVIALEYPELVRKLVIGSSAARISEERMNVLNEWIKLKKKKKREELSEAFGRALYTPEVYEQFKQALADMVRPVSKPELEKFVILAKGTKDFDILDRLPQINCPFLAIGSADDSVLGPEALREIVSAMAGKANFRWYEYDGYGHAAFDMAPDYRQRLFDFFAGE